MTTVERHLHFTGSLPVDLMVDAIRRAGKTTASHNQIDCLLSRRTSTLKQALRDVPPHLAALNSLQAYRKFFLLYRTIQGGTKSRDLGHIRWLYRSGGREQAKVDGLQQELTRLYTIGAAQTVPGMSARVGSFIEGYDSEAGKQPRVRLSFNRLAAHSLQGRGRLHACLRKLASAKPSWLSALRGFDISGPEAPKSAASVLPLIDLLQPYLKQLSEVSGHELDLSVHFGENCFDWTICEYEDLLEGLLSRRISGIGHGTFLWVPEEDLWKTTDTTGLRNSENKRLELLRRLPEAGIELEVCPSSSLVLSPLSDARAIPTTCFEEVGLKWSINTDNPSFFDTSLSEELALLGIGPKSYRPESHA